MIGAIIGDIIGSTYEFRNAERYDFDPFPDGSFFTDDTVLTVAVADALLNNESITCFLESENFEDAIRKAVWLGGDSDTIASITGSMAEAFYRKIPEEWMSCSRNMLPPGFLNILPKFTSAFIDK